MTNEYTIESEQRAVRELLVRSCITVQFAESY